jgi:hypothetical protein
MGFIYGGETHNCELPSNKASALTNASIILGSIWKCDGCGQHYQANPWGVRGPDEYFTWYKMSTERAEQFLKRANTRLSLGFTNGE